MGVLCVCGGWAVLTTATHTHKMQFFTLTFNPNKIKIVGGSFPPFNFEFLGFTGVWGVAPNELNTCYLFTCISIDK